MRWTGLIAVCLAGCSIFTTARPAGRPVVWQPFRLAYIAHPRLNAAGSEARLQVAARALAGERYLAAIVVSGELGAPPRRVAELLAESGCLTVVVDPGGPALSVTNVNRDLAVATVPRRGRDGAVAALRKAESRLRGRWACAAVGWDPRADAGLTYALESVERLRAVLLPAAADGVERRAALLYISTGPLADGHLRLLDVKGRRLRTWLRPLAGAGDPAADLPASEARTR